VARSESRSIEEGRCQQVDWFLYFFPFHLRFRLLFDYFKLNLSFEQQGRLSVKQEKQHRKKQKFYQTQRVIAEC
jgi:hypothetical protein